MKINNHDRINWRKWLHVSSLGTLGFLLLFYYQNCAPVEGSFDEASIANDDISPVTTIDNVNANTAVSFVQNKVQIHSQTEKVVLDGVCDAGQNGAILGWRIRDANGSELGRGYSQCDGGHFEVELNPTQGLKCDQAYHVTARLGLGTSGEVEIERRCEASATADASFLKADLKAEPESMCVIERRGARSCSAVCYDSQGIVQSEEALDDASCQ